MKFAQAHDLHRGRSVREGLRLWLLLSTALAFAGTVACYAGASIRFVLFGSAVAVILSLLVFLRFFRDFRPVRIGEKSLVVSPAHGVIDQMDIVNEEGFFKGKCQRISIYLSLRDVHVQNAPVNGIVRHIEFVPGARRRAIHRDAGLRNEALLMHFQDNTDPQRQVLLKLIAGVFVRRIVPWLATTEEVAQGQRISLIRFGSRVDVFVPLEAQLRVKVGDRVIGSETVLAVFHGLERKDVHTSFCKCFTIV
jgi:phosphatidylserine decarboxylase